MKFQDYQPMSKNKLIPELRFPEFVNCGEWKETILECCLDYLQPTPYLVNSTNYDTTHRIPVLTAGKTFILGYTDETDGVFDNVPVIIFDDFTTDTKFVDFPFKVKSSAIKILLAKENNNIKFVYEAIQNIRFTVGTHKRHWISAFSKQKILIPPDAKAIEQQKIADCLSSLDDLIEAHNQKLELLKQHKKGLMQNLFPKKREKNPELRFLEFENSEDWDMKELSNFISLYRGSSPRPIKDFLTQSEKGVNWIKIGDTKNVEGFQINKVEQKITIEGAEQSRKVSKGELVLANSMSYGATYELGIDGCIYDGWFVVREYEEHYSKEFLLQLLNSDFVQSQYKKMAAGGVVKNISSDIVYNVLLSKPSVIDKQKGLEEQKKIANCLSSLDNLIIAQTEKIEQLKQHKKGLMQGLFPTIGIKI